MSDHVIRSGVSTDAYREGWERIFGKPKLPKQPRKRKRKPPEPEPRLDVRHTPEIT